MCSKYLSRRILYEYKNPLSVPEPGTERGSDFFAAVKSDARTDAKPRKSS